MNSENYYEVDSFLNSIKWKDIDNMRMRFIEKYLLYLFIFILVSAFNGIDTLKYCYGRTQIKTISSSIDDNSYWVCFHTTYTFTLVF